MYKLGNVNIMISLCKKVNKQLIGGGVVFIYNGPVPYVRVIKNDLVGNFQQGAGQKHAQPSPQHQNQLILQNVKQTKNNLQDE